MSFKCNNNDSHCWSSKVCCISLWKVLGALQSPKGILFHSNNPKGVQKAVFGLTTSVTSTWL